MSGDALAVAAVLPPLVLVMWCLAGAACWWIVRAVRRRGGPRLVYKVCPACHYGRLDNMGDPDQACGRGICVMGHGHAGKCRV